MGNEQTEAFKRRTCNFVNFKECVPKIYEGWVCAPPVGTIVLNKIRYPGVLSRNRIKDYYTPKELAEMQKRSMKKYTDIVQRVKLGFYEEVTVDKLVVMGVMQELRTISVTEFAENWEVSEGSAVQTLIAERKAGQEVIFDWYRAKHVPFEQDKHRYLASFCNISAVGVTNTATLTANGGNRPAITVNERGVDHGKGDFLIVDTTKIQEGRHFLTTALTDVVNGNVFALTYNNTGWSKCLPDVTAYKGLSSKPTFSLLDGNPQTPVDKSGAVKGQSTIKERNQEAKANNQKAQMLKMFTSDVRTLLRFSDQGAYTEFVRQVNENEDVVIAFMQAVYNRAKVTGADKTKVSFYTFCYLQDLRKSLLTQLLTEMREITGINPVVKFAQDMESGWKPGGDIGAATTYEFGINTISFITRCVIENPRGSDLIISIYDEMGLTDCKAYAIIQTSTGDRVRKQLKTTLATIMQTISKGEETKACTSLDKRKKLLRADVEALASVKGYYSKMLTAWHEEAQKSSSTRAITRMRRLQAAIKNKSTMEVMDREWKAVANMPVTAIPLYALNVLQVVNKLYEATTFSDRDGAFVMLKYFECLATVINRIPPKLLKDGVTPQTVELFRMRDYIVNFDKLLATDELMVITTKLCTKYCSLAFSLDMWKALDIIAGYNKTKERSDTASKFECTMVGKDSLKAMFVDFPLLELCPTGVHIATSNTEGRMEVDVSAIIAGDEFNKIYNCILKMAKRIDAESEGN